jgi:outer membrane protein OmpA-like peptidoglycan-associated protein
MSLDLLDSLNSVLGGQIARRLGTSLGEPEEATRTAVTVLGPALLAGLMRRTATPGGASDMLHLLKDDRIDSGVVSQLTGLLNDSHGSDVLRATGAALLPTLLGQRADSVSASISQVAGIQPANARTLLAMVTPVFLGLVRKYAGAQGLNVSNLTAFLTSQRASLERAGLDSRITSALGASNISSLLGSVSGPVIRTAAHEEKRTRWWLWAAAVALAAVLMLFAFDRGGEDSDKTALTTQDAVVTKTPTKISSASTKVFFATDETTIDTNDRQKIAGIARTARGQGRDVAVTGYTDRTGDYDTNVRIAQTRALAVKNALVREGISESHIVVDPPATLTGKGSNADARRVDVILR